MFECRIAVVASAVFVLAAHCHAAVFCLSDSAAIADALVQAQGNGEDDDLQIQVGSYAPPGAIGSFYFAEIGHAITIEGGFHTPEGGPACSEHSDDAALTVIDGGGSKPLLRIDSATGSGDITVRKLTFRNGRAAGISAPLELLGAGANTVTLENAIVQGNVGDFFQSMYYVPAVWVAGEKGGIAIRNVLFVQNDAPAGVWSILVTHQQNAGPGVVFNNVTVTGNGANSGFPGVEFDVEGGLSIANSIFWGNASADLGIVQNNGTIVLDHNDIGVRTGSAPGVEISTVSVDPAFVSATDFCVDANSLLRDAGNSAAEGGVGITDVNGGARITFAAIDIGACEVADDTLFRDSFEG